MHLFWAFGRRPPLYSDASPYAKNKYVLKMFSGGAEAIRRWQYAIYIVYFAFVPFSVRNNGFWCENPMFYNMFCAVP